MDIGYYLIMIHRYEDLNYYLINYINGIMYKLDSIPNFSQNRDYFIDENIDPTGNLYSPCGLDVYKIKKDKIIKVLDIMPDYYTWGPINIRWINPKTFSFEKYYDEVAIKEGKLKNIILNEKIIYTIQNDSFVLVKK